MKFENHPNYNCEITFANGETYKIYANWMHNNDIDYWEGWLCATGYNRLYITKTLDVLNGECSTHLLGNIKTGWQLNDDKLVCPRERCTGCTDDLITEKEKQ